jgi:RecA-family ATPase
MLDAALCIATGEKWGGREVTRGRAIFISLEDQKRTLALRIRAWLAGRSEGRSEAEVERLTKAIKDPRRFQLLTREKAASLTVTTAEFGQTVVRAAVLDRIVKLCQGASLLVMETASRLHPVSEDNQSLSVFAGAVERIATRTGAGVVVVRHVSKERAGSDKADSYGGRGGGAFADAARSVLSVVPREKDSDPVRLVHTKSTHAPKGADLAWMWEAKQGAVFLRTASVKEKLKADSDRILAHVRNAGPKGLTWSEIEKKVNKTKIAATAWLLLDSLVQRKLVEEKIRKPERGQETTAYVVTQDGIDALPAAAEVRRPGREIKGQD